MLVVKISEYLMIHYLSVLYMCYKSFVSTPSTEPRLCKPRTYRNTFTEPIGCVLTMDYYYFFYQQTNRTGR